MGYPQQVTVFPQKISAAVTQTSVFDTLLWNIYINNMLNLLPNAHAYADDVTLSLNFLPGVQQMVTARLNITLRRLKHWRCIWQVNFVPQKIKNLVQV